MKVVGVLQLHTPPICDSGRPLSRFGTRGLVMANAAGMACRVICSGVFIRRFFLQGTTSSTAPLRSSSPDTCSSPPPPPPPPTPGNNTLRRKKPNRESKNLWRRVVTGALPHPGVVAAMSLSSVAAFAASPSSSAGGGDVPWDVAGAARHVVVGVACFVATAAVFARCEVVFVREVVALWAARRRPSSREDGDGGGGVVEGRGKAD